MAIISHTLFLAFKAAGKKGLTDKEVLKIVPNVGYVTHLERTFGCKFNYTKEGRKTVHFVLTNPNEADVPENGFRVKKTAAAKKPKAVAKVKTKAKTTVVEKKVKVEREKVVAPDADLRIIEVTDRELADIKSQLGLA